LCGTGHTIFALVSVIFLGGDYRRRRSVAPVIVFVHGVSLRQLLVVLPPLNAIVLVVVVTLCEIH
jgi:hypothetical protein